MNCRQTTNERLLSTLAVVTSELCNHSAFRAWAEMLKLSRRRWAHLFGTLPQFWTLLAAAVGAVSLMRGTAANRLLLYATIRLRSALTFFRRRPEEIAPNGTVVYGEPSRSSHRRCMLHHQNLVDSISSTTRSDYGIAEGKASCTFSYSDAYSISFTGLAEKLNAPSNK